MTNRYCFALDLVNDHELIEAYEDHHKHIWPEIKQSIFESGIEGLEIYRVENRLFMIIEAGQDFSLEKKAQSDASDEKVQEWEQLMWKYQQALPNSKPGEKWRRMHEICKLQS